MKERKRNRKREYVMRRESNLNGLESRVNVVFTLQLNQEEFIEEKFSGRKINQRISCFRKKREFPDRKIHSQLMPCLLYLLFIFALTY